jgi:shikimate kinase
MKNIVLTGFMGTGKSSVGKMLAKQMGYDYCDLDDVIVEQAGMTINEIFARYGETHFRDLEAKAVNQVSTAENLVIATGGGAVIREDNRKRLRSTGIIVNLEASLEEITARLSGNTDRPLLKDEKSRQKVSAMLKEREPYYAEADIRIDTTGKKVEDVVREIMFQLKGKF